MTLITVDFLLDRAAAKMEQAEQFAKHGDIQDARHAVMHAWALWQAVREHGNLFSSEAVHHMGLWQRISELWNEVKPKQ